MDLKRILAITAVATAAIAPVRAMAAEYIKVDYTGTVTDTFSGAPSWLVAGLPVSFEAIYNPAYLVDHTATADAVLSEFGLDPSQLPTSVSTASLSDDPYSSLTIKIGPETYSKFDQLQYGTPDGDTPIDLGVGNLPAADFIDGAFAGISNSFLSNDGVAIDGDPFNDLFGGFDGHAFGVGIVTPDDSDPLDTIVAEGDFNPSSVTFTPVNISAAPEPGAWALMLLGVSLVGLCLRKKTRVLATEACTCVA